MSLDTLYAQQRAALTGLTDLSKSRAQREIEIAERHRIAIELAEGDLGRAKKKISTEQTKADAETRSWYDSTVRDLQDSSVTQLADAAKKHKEATRRMNDQFDEAESTTQTNYRDKIWALDAMLEALEREAKEKCQKQERYAGEGRNKVEAIWNRAEQTLNQVKATREEVAFQVERLPSPTQTDPVGKLERCLEDSQAAVERLEQSFWLKLLNTSGKFAICIGVMLLFALIGLAIRWWPGALIGAGIGLILGGLIVLVALPLLARNRIVARGTALGVFLAETTRTCRILEDYSIVTRDHSIEQAKANHKQERKAADTKYVPLLQGLKTKFDTELDRANSMYDQLLRETTSRRDNALSALEVEFAERKKNETEKALTAVKTAESKHQHATQEANTNRDKNWAKLESDWHGGLAKIAETLQSLKQAGEHFPTFEKLKDSALPATVPLGIKYGDFTVCLDGLPDGISTDSRLTPKTAIDEVVPAFLPFPDQASILLKAKDDNRNAAVNVLQMMMLRYLTGLPAGKVRFTIIDPVGLGENFGSFMHLADSDEQLVNGRIWTEPSHIEARLADLTGHMETVIQKYLRNQYKSIEEYNRAAGEVAEAYRVLVIANFPTNFTPDAAKRLISIMQSGPSCGVCTLISVDQNAALPRDFRMADVEAPSLIFTYQHGRFQLAHPDYTYFPMQLDKTPDAKLTAFLAKRVGEASRHSGRVEVPFSFIAPAENELGKMSAAKELAIPVGRAGATRKQIFRLGVGTAQHALIAGKTGSGKSTLLHALITNLALHYDPSEVELYLIDFKKGVEFKAYATHKLPHARVIAIESEREFGLSVLQKLDAELRERGDRFRAAGVNDLAGYREETKKILPRILFIVDEFQEFFVEDDKLAQEASLLLDRLVRQGRAFGMHVILGSQTLGGAYSLARSTIDQMAVRVALQCSDADAQLILSKDNTAARLLSRPGEAIYNDANGLVEGNDPFQVVWLNEERRDELLDDVMNMQKGKSFAAPLVFEGNAGADLAKSDKLLSALKKPAVAKTPIAWLGDAIAIKDPTAVAFRSQSASNLLIIGQQDDQALAITAASMLSLRSQQAKVYVLDGTPDDGEYAGYLQNICESTACESIDRNLIHETLTIIASEVAERTAQTAKPKPPVFLTIFSLQRFRELRKSEDEYGYGKKEKQATTADLLSGIIKDGPSVGVHVVIWVDSLTNFNRAMDRQMLKEFGQRVLFQMSATDSSNLLDTPAASRLGRNRALFTQEEQDRPEKFRPYTLPGLEWIRSLGLNQQFNKQAQQHVGS